MNEASIATEYQKHHPRVTTSELPVGHLLLAEFSDTGVSDRATQFSLRADLHAPSDRKLTLVECKRTLNVRAIGQVLTYARLFDTDREVARTRVEQGRGLNSFSEAVVAPHIDPNGNNQSVRPSIEQLDLRIAVNELPSKARNGLLRACKYHGIRVDYFEHGGWTQLTEHVDIDQAVKPAVSPNTQSYNQQYTSLAKRASSELQSDAEEKVLDRMGVNNIDGHVFREIELTGNEPTETGGIRADAVVLPESAGPLHALELKNRTETGESAKPYYTGIGQSLSAAALCELELSIRTEPVLGMDSLPRIGGYLTINAQTSLPWPEMWPNVYAGAS